MNIAVGESTGVHLLDDAYEPLSETQRPFPIVGDRRRVRTGRDEGMPRDHRLVQRNAPRAFEHEVAVTQRRKVPKQRDDARFPETPEGDGLALRARHRVESVGGHSRVRPCLLQHDLTTVVFGGVDTTGVGVVQHPRDAREALGRAHLAELLHQRKEVRGDVDPLRRCESGPAHIGDEMTLGVTDRRRRDAVDLDEHAVEAAEPDEDRPLAPPQIGQDVRTAVVGGHPAQLRQRAVQRARRRVDRDELPGPLPAGILPVGGGENARAREVLERESLSDAVTGHDPQQGFGVVVGDAEMDLPALLGERRALGLVVGPDAVIGATPGCRDVRGEGHVACGRGTTAGVLVEVPVRAREHRVDRVHAPAHRRRRAVGTRREAMVCGGRGPAGRRTGTPTSDELPRFGRSTGHSSPSADGRGEREDRAQIRPFG